MNDQLSICEKNFVINCLAKQTVSSIIIERENIARLAMLFIFNFVCSASMDVSSMNFVNCPLILEMNGDVYSHRWAKPKCWLR